MEVHQLNLKLIKTLEFPLSWDMNNLENFDIDQNTVEDSMPLFNFICLILRIYKLTIENHDDFQIILTQLNECKNIIRSMASEK